MPRVKSQQTVSNKTVLVIFDRGCTNSYTLKKKIQTIQGFYTACYSGAEGAVTWPLAIINAKEINKTFQWLQRK